MATMLRPPVAPWMRELSRFVNTPGAASSFLPPADVIIREDGVTVYMDVPGMTVEQLDIELENNMLTVRGERRPPWESLEGATARIERSFGAFERTLRVTDDLDPDAIEAAMSDGVLTLRLPQPAHPRSRRIQIRPSASIGSGSSPSAAAQGGGAESAPAAEDRPGAPGAGAQSQTPSSPGIAAA